MNLKFYIIQDVVKASIKFYMYWLLNIKMKISPGDP